MSLPPNIVVTRARSSSGSDWHPIGSSGAPGSAPGGSPSEHERLDDARDARRGRGAGRAGIDGKDVDLVLVATTTADELMPNAAPLVAHALGATHAGAFDIGAACTGFMSALATGAAMIDAGRAGCVRRDRRRLHVPHHRPAGPRHRRRVRRRRRRDRAGRDRGVEPDRTGRARLRRQTSRAPSAYRVTLTGSRCAATRPSRRPSTPVGVDRAGGRRRRGRARRDRPVRLPPGQRPDPRRSRRAARAGS